MRIAQVAPLYESVPPKYYGGTERVVSYLTEELVRQGHDVTLYASGDSVTKARLVAACRRSLRLDKRCVDQLAHHVRMLELVAKEASRYDLDPLPHRLPAFPAVAPARRSAPDHAARTPRHPRSPRAVPRVQRDAGGVDLECAAGAAAGGQLDGDGVPWTAAGPLPGPGAPGDISGVSRPDLAREARRSRDRDCPPPGHAAEDRRQGRRSRPRVLREHDRTAVAGPSTPSTSARSAKARRTSCWATRTR